MRRFIVTAIIAAWAASTLFAAPVEDWQEYEAAVRDGTITEDEALIRLDPLIEGLSTYITSNYCIPSSSWTFPLAGYDRRAMVKKSYRTAEQHRVSRTVENYSFFEGSLHAAHPAYDINVKDKNHDAVDDLTGAPVEVVATMDSVVISTYKGWTRGSMFKDGNYAWLYNPVENKFFYYAHLKDIKVDPGQFVRGGESIATVGLTGFMPRGKKEKTHLHLMVLEYDKGRFLPYDYYTQMPEPRLQKQ